MFLFSCSRQAGKKTVAVPGEVIAFPYSLKDSLEKEVKLFDGLSSDTARLSFLIKLSDSNRPYRKELLNYVIANASKISQRPYKVIAYCKIGKDFLRRNLPDSAIRYFKQGIDFCKKHTIESREAAAIYREFGSYYARKTDFANGLLYYRKAVDIAEKCGHKAYMHYLCEMGKIYQSISQPAKASACFLSAKTYAFKTKDYSLQIFALNSLGDLYRALQKPDSSILYHLQALDVHEKWHHTRNEPWAITSLGKSYTMKNDFVKAEEYFGLILKEGKQNKLNDLAAQAYLHLAICDLKRNKPDRAVQNAHEGYELSLKHPDLDLRGALAGLLSEIYTRKKQFDKALFFYKIERVLYDSIENVQQVKKLAEAEFHLKEENLIGKVEKNAEKLRLEEEKGALETKRHNLIVISVLALLIMALLFSVFIYRSLQKNRKQNGIISEQKKQVEEQKDIIEKKQEEIVSSIHYARSIQKTLLTDHKFISDNIPDNFIFYKPKDIVSGDFYWAARQDNKFYLAVCDSTGHGVPGAFMSLLNIGFLSEAVNEKKIADPGEIFNYVRNRLVHSISKENKQDGFDGVLICVDLSTKQIEYVAANNCPVLLRNGVCEELPFDKMPVGIGPKMNEFRTHRIKINPGDILYLFTDGFEDQFGGPAGKKFRSKNMQSLFMEYKKTGIAEQMEHMSEAFEKWKTYPSTDGNPKAYDQVDDVCVVGIKLT